VLLLLYCHMDKACLSACADYNCSLSTILRHYGFLLHYLRDEILLRVPIIDAAALHQLAP
jgi:hypothetical protein